MTALGAYSVLAAGDVLWRDVGGEIVILDQDGEKILGLNRTGGAMWRLLDGERTLGQIAAEIARVERAVTEEQVLADVLAFARTLVDQRLALVP